MRILFVCGSLEPGRDGVGDYSRVLAAQLRVMGWGVRIVSLYDRGVDTIAREDQATADAAVLTLRIPRATSERERFDVLTGEVLSVRPDVVSLQYVPYSFNDRGFPFTLAARLAGSIGAVPLHIMFHELWIASRKGSGLSAKLTGRLQRGIIRRMLSRLAPARVTTQLPLYQERLLPQVSELLPLFGNIAIARDCAMTPHAGFRVVSFGSCPSPGEFRALAECIGRRWALGAGDVHLRFVGRGGKHKPEVLEVARETFGRDYVTDAGPLSAAEISCELQAADLGIAKNSGEILGKSGSAVAMLEHGLPVLVSGAKPARPSVAAELAASVHYTDDPPDDLPWLKSRPHASVHEVAELFVSLLGVGSARRETSVPL